MIDAHFRKILPRHTKKLMVFYDILGVTPNGITFAGLFLSAVSATLIIVGLWHWALGFWWLSRLLDGTDGIYARQKKLSTPLGAFLDILSDMAAYSLMILGFAVSVPQLSLYWLVILFFYILCITSALALGSLEQTLQIKSDDNRGLRLATGIAEGGETGIAYSCFLLFPEYLEMSLRVWIFILFVTVCARVVLAYKWFNQYRSIS